MVGRCEVAAHAGGVLEPLVVMELGAVVEGDGLEGVALTANGSLHGAPGVGHGASG